jgi:4-amino-4-deoxy-L-arabinose transferase-like glycosyltransferase
VGFPVTRFVLAILAALALVVGIGNMDRRLANPDEGRYSEISREMAASGDWVTPRLNGLKYFEKPPLQYWATALAFKAFGESEVSARLYVGLCALATLLLAGFMAWRLHGPGASLATMLVLVASPYFLALGGIVTLDVGLTLWTTATFFALLLAEQSAAAGREREGRRWMLGAWAAMALAVLSKGLIGIVFAGAAVFFVIALTRSLAILKRMQWGWGLLVFFAIAAPWFVAVSAANPEFARFFFVHEHFERFLTQSHRRVQAWWFFLPILALGLLPWLLALPSAVVRAWRSETGAVFQPLRTCLLWSAFIVAFFSASGSKLPAYVLPAFPPLALVLGFHLAQAPERKLAALLAPVVLVALILGWYGWHLPETARDEWTRAMYVGAQRWAGAAAAILLAATIAATAMLWHARRWAALVTMAAATILMLECVENAYGSLSPRQSGYEVAQKMKPYLAPGTRLYSVAHYDQSLPFYIARTLTLVAYVDEFETGQKAEPALSIATLEGFPAEWQRPGEALAIMQPGAYEKLKASGLPMQVLHDDPRRVLVRKP